MELQMDTVAKGLQSLTLYELLVVLTLGGILVFALVLLMRWIIDQKIATLPADIKEIKNDLSAIKVQQARMEERLWSPDVVAKLMRSTCHEEIHKHVLECPLRTGAAEPVRPRK